MYKISIAKESTTTTEDENIYNETLMKEIINLKYNIEKLEDENFALKSQLNFSTDEYYKYINKLETKIRHIEQYFDDLDDIDYKTIKKEVERILNE